jgi:hypothetical protein
MILLSTNPASKRWYILPEKKTYEIKNVEINELFLIITNQLTQQLKQLEILKPSEEN